MVTTRVNPGPWLARPSPVPGTAEHEASAWTIARMPMLCVCTVGVLSAQLRCQAASGPPHSVLVECTSGQAQSRHQSQSFSLLNMFDIDKPNCCFFECAAFLLSTIEPEEWRRSMSYNSGPRSQSDQGLSILLLMPDLNSHHRCRLQRLCYKVGSSGLFITVSLCTNSVPSGNGEDVDPNGCHPT